MKTSRQLVVVLLTLAVLISGASLGFAEKKSTGNVSQQSEAKVNINTGTSDQLKTLPGIGPATAQRIIEHRTKNGPFKKPEDLMSVKGIGQKKFSVLKDRITV